MTYQIIDTISPSEASALYSEEINRYKSRDFSRNERLKIRQDLKPRGIILDEYLSHKTNKLKYFFCLARGHNWRDKLEKYYQTKERCPECLEEEKTGIRKDRREYKYLTIDVIQERLKHKNVELVVETYINTTKPAEVRCLKCGGIRKVRQIGYMFNDGRMIGCLKCSKGNRRMKSDEIEKLFREFLLKYDIEILEYKNSLKPSKIKCLKCGCEWIRGGLHNLYKSLKKSPNKRVNCPCCSGYTAGRLKNSAILKQGVKRR